MLRQKLGSIIALAFLIFLVAYTVANRELLEPLLNVSVPILIAITTIKIAQIFINGLFTKVTLDAFDKPISHKESAYIALLSSLGNYFGPLLGGMGVRAAYLKKQHGFALTHFVGTLYGYYLVNFFITALIGLIGAAIVYQTAGVYSLVIILLFLGIMVSTGILFFLKVPKISGFEKRRYIGKVYKRLNQISEGWEILASNKILFGKLLAVGLALFMVGLATAYFEFQALHINVGVGALLLYTTLGALSLLVSFTPGAIGIRESIYFIFSSVLLISNSQVLQLAAIDRGISLSVLLIAYIYLQFIQKRR